MSTSEVRVGLGDDTTRIDSHEDDGSEYLAEVLAARGMPIQEVLNNYDFVDADADKGYIVMADRRHMNARGAEQPGKVFASVDMSVRELGSAAPSPWTAWTRQEWVPELRERQGLTKFYRMKRQDGVVRGALRALKTPLLAAHWYVKPASQKPLDLRIAAFVQDNLFCYLNVSWFNLLNDILLCADYGYMPFEKVYHAPVVENRRFVQRLRKLAPRHPMDVREWQYDANGGPDAIVMEGNLDNPTQPSITIPISKLAVYTLEAEAGDLTGISVLRSAYKHWYFKDTLYKIDAIQKERHGIGIPVIKLPLGYSTDDKKAADELGSNLRTNERAHVTLPPGWDLIFAKVEGQMVDCMRSIEHHDMAIMANVLSSWLKEPSAKSETLDMFMKSTRYVAACIVDITNRYVIRELVQMNWFEAASPSFKFPELVCRRVGEWEDLRTQSFTIRNLVGAGVIEPDDKLEEVMREELDMPPKDSATARKMITDPASMQKQEDENDKNEELQRKGSKQDTTADNIERQGGSRQQPSPPGGSGRTNTGTDRSGG